MNVMSKLESPWWFRQFSATGLWSLFLSYYYRNKDGKTLMSANIGMLRSELSFSYVLVFCMQVIPRGLEAYSTVSAKNTAMHTYESIQRFLNTISFSVLHNDNSGIPIHLTPFRQRQRYAIHCYKLDTETLLYFSSHYSGNPQCQVQNGKMLVCAIHKSLVDLREYHDDFILLDIRDGFVV